MVETMTISDDSSLYDWQTSVRNLWFPSSLPQAEFRLPSFSESANRQLTLEALRLHRACGCTAAGLGMTAAILLVALALAGGETSLGEVPLVQWIQYFLFVLGASAVGKLSGLLWARRRMVQLADTIGVMAGRQSAVLRMD